MRETSPPSVPGVLVDSSVWIDFLRPSPAEDLRAAVAGVLARDEVFTTAIIQAEVVQGAPDETSLDALLEEFAALRPIILGIDVATTAARIGYAMRRLGRPTPTADLLIAAAALSAECELWHRDEHFTRIARVAPLRERRF